MHHMQRKLLLLLTDFSHVCSYIAEIKIFIHHTMVAYIQNRKKMLKKLK